jgi:hypothetical protein
VNVIDSFFVALGFRVDMSGLNELKAKTDEARESLLSWGHALVGIVGGLALHKVAEIGSTFEQNRIQIAGFLEAFGKASDFNEGLKLADESMQSILTAAAKLPGEADEYIEVFRAGLPVLSEAMPGGSLAQMRDFTNHITALGKAMKIPSQLISQELGEILSPGQGTARKGTPLFAKFLGLIRTLPGQKNMEVKEFNALPSQKRLELLQATFAKLQPMLDASADSFDAMWGSLKSAIDLITRIGTGGLFIAMKRQIAQFTAEFVDDEGKLTKGGNDVVGVLRKLSSVVITLMRDGLQLTFWLAGLAKHSLAVKVALAGLVALMAGSVWESTVGRVIKFASALRAATLTTGLLAVGLFLVAEDLWGFFHGADSVTGMLVKKWGPAVYFVWGALGALALGLAKVSGLLPMAIGLLNFAGKTIGILGGMVGKLMGFMGPLVGRVIAMGVAWAVANLPIVLTVAALGLVAFAIYELWKNWDKVVGWLSEKWQGFVDTVTEAGHALGLLTDQEEAAYNAAHRPQMMLPAGQGVMAPAFGPQPQTVGMWEPQGFRMTGGGDSTVNHGDVRIDKIEINGAKDPKETGREVARQVRTAQSGRKR